MFYADMPCEWCDSKKLTLCVETPQVIDNQVIMQYSYLCVQCISDCHEDAELQLSAKPRIIRIK